MASVIRTIDALTQLVQSLRNYLGHVDRMGADAPDVKAGEWNVEWNNGPSLVVVGLGKRVSYMGAAAEEPGYRSSPNPIWDNGDGTASEVVGVRKQSFTVWVHYGPGDDFTSHDPEEYPVDMRVQTLALSDVVDAGIRYLASHDLLGEDGTHRGERRGEFIFGSTVTWGFVIPVPVLGDAFPFVTPAGMSATTLFAGTSPGDTLST